ncbi:MAG: RNA methyltransferase [Candidatus Cloacimonetes bacterium]|jgi:TrmH family RNA methyltransferase
MNKKLTDLSKNRIKELTKLKQKNYRLQKKLVVVEGLRTLEQIKFYGIKPIEQYLLEGMQAIWENVPTYYLNEGDMHRICDSEHPSGLAALFPIPQAQKFNFNNAFYLDKVSDPGNLGSIFRIAAAFSLDTLLLSPECVEVSSPKVIRSSCGSVYKVPFQQINISELKALQSRIVLADAHKGQELTKFKLKPEEKLIIVFGSEAQGISSEISSLTDEALHIKISSAIESLNVSISAAIIAYHLFIQKSTNQLTK